MSTPNTQTATLIKLGLAVLFFVCLLDMPYGYYQLVRAIAMIGFGVLAYQSYGQEKMPEVIIYIGLLLLFQPIIKLSLGRDLWNIVDVVVGAGLVLSVGVKKGNTDAS